MHKTPAFVQKPKPNSLSDGILGGRRWWVSLYIGNIQYLWFFILDAPLDFCTFKIYKKIHGRGSRRLSPIDYCSSLLNLRHIRQTTTALLKKKQKNTGTEVR